MSSGDVWGTQAGKRVKVRMMEYRWRNFGQGTDDDGIVRQHPGVVWMRREPTTKGEGGEVQPWVKVDLRRYIDKKPVLITDGFGYGGESIRTSIRDARYDLYTGLLELTDAKEHDIWKLSRHLPCRCAA